MNFTQLGYSDLHLSNYGGLFLDSYGDAIATRFSWGPSWHHQSCQSGLMTHTSTWGRTSRELPEATFRERDPTLPLHRIVHLTVLPPSAGKPPGCGGTRRDNTQALSFPKIISVKVLKGRMYAKRQPV